MVLPEDLVANVLSRLPIKTILHCKCVCKRWRYILSQPYFAQLHLSRSTEGLIVHPERSDDDDSDTLKLVEIDGHHIHHDPIMRCDLGLGINYDELRLCGSVNGLICLWYYLGAAAYICNPITREFILIPYEKDTKNPYSTETYGFGFAAASNQYKVVRFYSTKDSDCKLMCEIYTLGTGIWRSLGEVPFQFSTENCTLHFNGIFVGGDLHWLICDPNDTDYLWGCSLDLEKEKFHLTAYVPGVGGNGTYRNLGMLNGCLCICEVRYPESEFVIWVMKEYGMNESWSKEIVIRYNHLKYLHYEAVHPLKVLKDGTLLLVCCDDFLYTYHPRRKKLQRSGLNFGPPALRELDIFSGRAILNAMVYVPSFIRLNSFMLEKVSGF